MGFVTGPRAHTCRTHSRWVAGPGRKPQGRVVGRWRAPNSGSTSGDECPPLGALLPPPKRARPARKSARCWVGDGSPRPHPPHSQPVGSRPRPHAPRTDGWAGESAQLRTPNSQARGSPPRLPFCCPHSAQSQLARARAVGLVTGPHAHAPRTDNQWVAGPGRTAQGRAVVRGRAPNPRRTTLRREAPPPGALVPPPQCGKPARKIGRCGVGDGFPHPHAPCPRKTGGGPGPPAPWTGGSGRKRAQPGAPQTGARGALPQAALCGHPSAQRQPARACVVGTLTDPHPCTPRARGNKGSRPRPPAPRTDGRGRESGQPRTPLDTTGVQDGRRQGRAAPPWYGFEQQQRSERASRNHSLNCTAVCESLLEKSIAELIATGEREWFPCMSRDLQSLSLKLADTQAKVMELEQRIDALQTSAANATTATDHRIDILQSSNGECNTSCSKRTWTPGT